MHWCVDCGSALAEAEVEYEDKTSPAIDVGFAVADHADLAKRFDIAAIDETVQIIIWTTTPWTLPANQAVALHPEFQYALVRTSKGLLILADSLRETALTRYGLSEGAEVVAHTTGQALEGVLLWHPFQQRQVPVIVGDHVTADAGTGAVHTAPGHGLDDYMVGRPLWLESGQSGGRRRPFLRQRAAGRGMSIWQANPLILENAGSQRQPAGAREALTQLSALLAPQDADHFPRDRQWFIGMDARGQGSGSGIREPCVSRQWRRSTRRSSSLVGRARLEAMIKNRPDWCVSRQRNWACRCPFSPTRKRRTASAHGGTAGTVARRVEAAGIEAWFALDPAELLGDDAAHYDKTGHTLDVWFDSGVTHAAC